MIGLIPARELPRGVSRDRVGALVPAVIATTRRFSAHHRALPVSPAKTSGVPRQRDRVRADQ